VKQQTDTGIGRALRSAREHRGKSLDEAGRDTRVRTDYLDALEREAFDTLGSDVYVRGFLRSYAKYLGLNHEKVVGAYERVYGRPKPAPAPVERAATVAPTEALVLTERKRPNWLLAASAALVVLAAAAAIGLIGRGSDAVPPSAEVTVPPEAPLTGRPVTVGIKAFSETSFRIVVDGGEPTEFTLQQDQQRSFEGEDSIEVSADHGGTFLLRVNDHDIPIAGDVDASYLKTFTPQNYREDRSPEPTA
jgi:hypothetical protein